MLIVSFDGGGCRGILSATFARAVESRTGVALGRHADLLCGSSTGAVLAAGLASGLSAGDAVELYVRFCGHIFRHRWRAWLRSFWTARYDAEPLEEGLREIFGGARLGDLDQRLLVTAYDRLTRRAVILKSWKREHARVPVWQACRASAAAQTYFPPARLGIDGQRYVLVDGGTVANHPALCGLAEGVRLGHPLSQLRIVSFGTGQPDDALGADGGLDWGIAESLPHLAGELLDGPSEVVDYQARQILGARYARLQVPLPPGLQPMDRGDPEHMAQLVSFAERRLARGLPGLERAVDLVGAHPPSAA